MSFIGFGFGASPSRVQLFGFGGSVVVVPPQTDRIAFSAGYPDKKRKRKEAHDPQQARGEEAIPQDHSAEIERGLQETLAKLVAMGKREAEARTRLVTQLNEIRRRREQDDDDDDVLMLLL